MLRDDANLWVERHTTSSHSAAGADGPEESREGVSTERSHTRKSPEPKALRHAYARQQSGCAGTSERAGIRDDEHRLIDEADERRLLLFKEETCETDEGRTKGIPC